MIARSHAPRLFVLYVFGMVLASMFDYEITAYLAREALWANVLEIAGEPPALLFTAFNFALLGAWCISHAHPVRTAFCVLGALISCLYACGRTAAYITGNVLPALTVPLGCALCFALFAGMFGTSVGFRERWVRTACACIGAALTVLIVVSLLKQLWGRVRYRQLLADPSLSFTPWYRLNGPGNPSHVSFPSGHTANVTVIFLVSLYFPGQRKWLQPLLYALIAFMAVGRLAAGAHYLSDVLTGGAITFVICEIWVRALKVTLPETENDHALDAQ